MAIIKDYLLVMKIRLGDSAAWETLVEKYYDSIYTFCFYRFFRDKILAEDLTQDIFLKLVENMDSYQFTGKFYNYLFTIAVNTCNNYAKKKRLLVTDLTEATSLFDEIKIEATVINKENAEKIQVALNNLPDIQREAIILKYYYGMKVKDIATITECSLPTTQSRIHQGLKKMEKVLNRGEFSFE